MPLNEDRKKTVNKGFEQLLGVHMDALEENSQAVVEILELLKKKKLSVRDRNSLKKVSRELRAVDKRIDNIDKAPKVQEEKEEENEWFNF